MVQMDGGVVGVVLAGPDPDDPDRYTDAIDTEALAVTLLGGITNYRRRGSVSTFHPMERANRSARSCPPRAWPDPATARAPVRVVAPRWDFAPTEAQLPRCWRRS